MKHLTIYMADGTEIAMGNIVDVLRRDKHILHVTEGSRTHKIDLSLITGYKMKLRKDYRSLMAFLTIIDSAISRKYL